MYFHSIAYAVSSQLQLRSPFSFIYISTSSNLFSRLYVSCLPSIILHSPYLPTETANASVMSSQAEKPISPAPGRKELAEQREDEILAAPVPVVESVSTTSGFFHNIDGGVRGWSAVLGAWLFQFAMVGAITAFGSYQTFYEDQWLNVSS